MLFNVLKAAMAAGAVYYHERIEKSLWHIRKERKQATEKTLRLTDSALYKWDLKRLPLGIFHNMERQADFGLLA